MYFTFTLTLICDISMHDICICIYSCGTYIHPIGYDGVEVMGSEGYLINQVIFFKSQLTTKSNVEKNCIADL